MKRFKNWKTNRKAIAFAAFFSLLVALQPAIAYAGGCAGGHTGC